MAGNRLLIPVANLLSLKFRILIKFWSQQNKQIKQAKAQLVLKGVRVIAINGEGSAAGE